MLLYAAARERFSQADAFQPTEPLMPPESGNEPLMNPMRHGKACATHIYLVWTTQLHTILH